MCARIRGERWWCNGEINIEDWKSYSLRFCLPFYLLYFPQCAVDKWATLFESSFQICIQFSGTALDLWWDYGDCYLEFSVVSVSFCSFISLLQIFFLLSCAISCAPLLGAIWFCPLWSFDFYVLLQLHLLLIGYYLDYRFPHLVSVNGLKFYYHDELFSVARFSFTLILLLHFLSLKNLIL